MATQTTALSRLQGEQSQMIRQYHLNFRINLNGTRKYPDILYEIFNLYTIYSTIYNSIHNDFTSPYDQRLLKWGASFRCLSPEVDSPLYCPKWNSYQITGKTRPTFNDELARGVYARTDLAHIVDQVVGLGISTSETAVKK